MTMKELMKKTPEELDDLALIMAERGNLHALGLINEVRQYAHKRVKVVKGRKVPVGTEGVVFWMGSFDNSKYGDPWGIYTTVRVGIRTDLGEVHWTDINNVEVMDDVLTEEEQALVDEQMDRTDAIIEHKDGKWYVSAPEDTFVYNTKEELLADIRYTLNELRAEQERMV